MSGWHDGCTLDVKSMRVKRNTACAWQRRRPWPSTAGVLVALMLAAGASRVDAAGWQGEARTRGPSAAHLGRRTVKDVPIGGRVTLRDPVSGRVDSGVRIEDAFIDQGTRLPVAFLRFSSGETRHVAVDRLRLVGAPLSVQRRHLRRLQRDTAQQLEKGLGLRLRFRTTTQSAAVFARGLPAAAEGYRSTEGWGAYAKGREIRLDRDHYEAFVPAVRIHEALHTAESETLAWDARRADLMSLIEGITDYFTEKVCHANRLPFVPAHGYSDGPMRVAAQLDRVLGEGRLLRIFREGSLVELRRQVDEAAGQSVFARVEQEIAAGHYRAAAAALGR